MTFEWWKQAMNLDLYHGDDGKNHRHKVSFFHPEIFSSMIANWVFSFHFFVYYSMAYQNFSKLAQLHLEPWFWLDKSWVLSPRALSVDWRHFLRPEPLNEGKHCKSRRPPPQPQRSLEARGSSLLLLKRKRQASLHFSLFPRQDASKR